MQRHSPFAGSRLVTALMSAVTAVLCLTVTPADAGTDSSTERRQAGKHEHGTSTLDVALEGDVLAIELAGPADNFIGFEHAPHTPAQTARLADAVATLKQGPRLFVVPVGAGCQGTRAEVTPPKFPAPDSSKPDGDDDDADHGHHDEGGQHADMSASWEFRCKQPAQLKSITVTVFDAFPGTEKLLTSVIGPAGQAGLTLTKGNPVIHLDR